MKIRTLALAAAATIAVAVGSSAGTSSAARPAHVPNSSANCAGVTATADDYPQGYTATVTIDHASTHSLFLANPDPYKSHTWHVKITAPDWPTYDASGTIPVCAEHPTTTVAETTLPATTLPATTLPATTVPETTEPATTEPQTTVPETTAPETTVATCTGICSPADSTPGPTIPEHCVAFDRGDGVIVYEWYYSLQDCTPAVDEPNAPSTDQPTAVAPADETTTTLASSLPVTGSDTGAMLGIGLATLGAGTALVVVARRRQRNA